MPDPAPPPPVSRSRWLLAVAIIAMATIGITLVPPAPDGSHAPAGEASAPMLAVAPGGVVELASLPADHQTLYRAAAADPEAFEAVPCYCGCESFLDHRHLLDCFVRPSGGWERHATGCAVCLAQAHDVSDMRDDGVPLDQIIRTIDRSFGGFTDTTTT